LLVESEPERCSERERASEREREREREREKGKKTIPHDSMREPLDGMQTIELMDRTEQLTRQLARKNTKNTTKQSSSLLQTDRNGHNFKLPHLQDLKLAKRLHSPSRGEYSTSSESTSCT
jgi:hypothetical protein